MRGRKAVNGKSEKTYVQKTKKQWAADAAYECWPLFLHKMSIQVDYVMSKLHLLQYH